MPPEPALSRQSTDGDLPTATAGPPGPAFVLLTAATVALVGSVLLGLLECLLAAALVSRKLAGGSIPGMLLAPAVGRAALTHLLLWLPVMLAVGLGYWGIFRKRTRACPLAAVSAIFILLAGALVVPADLELAGKARPNLLALGWLLVLAAASGKYFGQRWLHRRLSRRVYGGLLAGFSLASVLVMTATGWAFVRSPLFDPGRWRLLPTNGRSIPAGRPSVLWIVCDTARADRMSCYGHLRPTTPFLSQWARDALVCELAIANGMWTVPSHASMFTGLSLREHGTDHRNLWLDDSFDTIAELLAEHGYATALFSNNPLVVPQTNLTQGFQTRQVVYHLRHVTRFSLEYLCEWLGLAPPVPWLDQDFGAALTNWLVADWLERHPGEPGFVFVNYMETHLPYRVPGRYRRLFLDAAQVRRSYALRRRAYGDLVTRLDLDYNISGSDFLAPDDAELLRRQYDAAVRYPDDRIRELVELFAARGLLENTLVLVASDHGEYLGTHGMWGHRFLTYQDLAHAALMLREPGRQVGRRLKRPVQLSDLFATVLNFALPDSAASRPAGSRDLRALAENPEDSPAVAICECGGPAPMTLHRFENCTDPVILHRTTPQIAAVGERFKLIISADGRRELYDLPADPGEAVNVIESFPVEAQRLDAYVRRWLETTPAHQPRGEKGRPLAPDVLKALRSLGYIGDEDD